jgi:hypothetical protein
MSFNKNLFLVNNDDMHPYINKGDVAIYEPMQLGQRMASSVYIVEYQSKKMIVRVQLLVQGGMCLLFDNDKGKMVKLKPHEQGEVVFIGYVTGQVNNH